MHQPELTMFLFDFILCHRDNVHSDTIENDHYFPTLQTSLKLVIKFDVKFKRFLYITDSVIVTFHIKS